MNINNINRFHHVVVCLCGNKKYMYIMLQDNVRLNVRNGR